MRGRIVRLSLLFIVVAALFTLVCAVSASACAALPNAYALTSPKGLDLTYLEVERLIFDEGVKAEEAKRKAPSIAGSSSSLGRAAHPYSPYDEQNVYITRTGEGYAEMAKLTMVSGVFFDVDTIPERNRVVIISDSLAVKFFQDMDVIGEQLALDDVYYTITGVYKSDASIISRMSSMGFDTVYIPYLQASDDVELHVDTLLWANSGAGFAEYFEDTVSKLTGRAFAAARVKDYAAVQSALRGEQLPLEYLPEDRIFDISHYADSVFSMLQERNYRGGNDYMWNVSVNALFVELALLLPFSLTCIALVAEAVCFIVWLRRAKRRI